MRKFGLGVVIALTLAALAYAAVLALPQDRLKPVAQAVTRSPEDIAARERMARLVAEVAARSAAQSARRVALERLEQRRAAQAAKAAAPPPTTVAATP